MIAYDSLLAVALLTAGPGSPEPVGLQTRFSALREPLQKLAVRWEILDPRETRYILARPEDFVGDLNLLRRRYHELANAPAVADHQRFPDKGTVNNLLAFNRAYRQHIDVRQPVELIHWWELRLALQETDRLHQVWDAVRDARCDYYYVTVRRQALKKLRDLIGEDAYYNTNLPPCAPLWQFHGIN
jgi:hypothetical protein